MDGTNCSDEWELVPFEEPSIGKDNVLHLGREQLRRKAPTADSPQFTDKQVADLTKSGITTEEASRAGVTVVSDPVEAGKILNWEGLGPVPSLVFPYFPRGDRTKSPLLTRLKPDCPRLDQEGRAVKYEQPCGVPTEIYVPGNIDVARLDDVNETLFVSEGEKKAIKLNACGFVAISSAGVWNFHVAGANSTSERVLKPAFDSIPIRGREVVIVFDALKFEKPGVLRAEVELARMLLGVGAMPRLAHLIDDDQWPPNGEDFGVDDYLASFARRDFLERIVDSAYVYPLSDHIGRLGQERRDDQAKKTLGKRLPPYLAVTKDPLEAAVIRDFLVKEIGLGKADLMSFTKAYREREGQHRRKSGPPRDKDRRALINWESKRPYEERFDEISSALLSLDVAYRLGNLPAVISTDGRNVVRLFNVGAFTGFFSEHIEFFKGEDDDDRRYVLPTSGEVDTFLNRASSITKFREVEAIANQVAYDHDFNLLAPGFHAASKIFVTGEPITPTDVVYHIERLLDELCYAPDGSKANRLAGLLAGLFPTHFQGDKPLILYQGNQRGLGKSWASEVDSIIRTGGYPAPVTYTPDDAELEKQFASAMVQGFDEVLIDNAKVSRRSAEISSAVLERSITDPKLNFRILGQSKFITRPNTVQFALTANSPKLSTDIISRAMAINLHYEGDPTRRSFSVADPRQYAMEHRKAILAELIGMVERWKKAGAPRAAVNFRFKRYAEIIGGILEVNGYDGFLSNLKRSEELFSSDHADLVTLFTRYPDIKGNARTFVERAQALELFQGEFAGKKGTGLDRQLAGILSRYVDRDFVVGPDQTVVLRAERNSHTKTQDFYLERVGTTAVIAEMLRGPSPQGKSLENLKKDEVCGDAVIIQTLYKESSSNSKKKENNIEGASIYSGGDDQNITASPQTAGNDRPSGLLDNGDHSSPSPHHRNENLPEKPNPPANQEDWYRAI